MSCVITVLTEDFRSDYIAPFNPRGDGYQKPSSSSTGSAVACARYDWLDFTIGTDTGGSIRHPAGVNGIFGTRPSLDSVSATGRAFSVSTLLDTIGVFARSASILQLVSNIIASPSFTMLPQPRVGVKYKLLFPVREQDCAMEKSLSWFPYPGVPGKAAEAEDKLETFVQRLEQHLDCKRSVFNMDELWRKTRPSGQPDSLFEATKTLYQDIVYYTYTRETIDPFIKDYSAANNGRKPHLDGLPQARQAYGRGLTPEQHEAAVQDYGMFAKWVLDVLLAPTSPNEVPLLIFPRTWSLPDYRDTLPAPDRPLFWNGFSQYSISYCSGCPDFTVPVGEVPYHSRVTDCEEMLPVSLALLGRPAMDRVMLGLLKELEDSGALLPVKTGSRMYE